MGTAFAHSDDPLSCFGLNHVNESGKCFLPYLSINNLAVVTFFKKNPYASGSTLAVKRHTKFITLLIKKCFMVVLTLLLHYSCMIVILVPCF